MFFFASSSPKPILFKYLLNVDSWPPYFYVVIIETQMKFLSHLHSHTNTYLLFVCYFCLVMVKIKPVILSIKSKVNKKYEYTLKNMHGINTEKNQKKNWQIVLLTKQSKFACLIWQIS